MNSSANHHIGILGSTGHISKNLILYFSQQKNYTLTLFSRNPDRLQNIINNFHFTDSVSISSYENFESDNYDVIINCIGISNPEEIKNKVPIQRITEKYDNKVLDYLDTHTSTLYIFISSGAVYGTQFENPVTDKDLTQLNINNLSTDDFYTVAKINSEAKHRALNDFNIVDLRLFAFFSRFMESDTSFLMSEIISAIKNKKTFSTNSINIVRDFVHPEDLFSLIQMCIKKHSINDAFDVYSKAPVSKFEILELLSKEYSLNFEIKNISNLSFPTGSKRNYYSLSKKASLLGYNPKFTSLETISKEIKYFMN